ncbi:MAG TPA: maleylpyruvate isomerase family mycothiol-dependent enzyme [Jatrophihabitans sp.]|jgi:uncharacterized protein (TIGR03083 family)|nr:maleylpyruvate isomerase family mycothiol-dependent enzyme [Jatrophihabitans sp.]
MEVPALIAQLSADGPLLIAAAQRAGWDAPVPATNWAVRDLVLHIGGVHRWAADIVTTGSRTGDTAAGRAVGTGPDDDGLIEWFKAGHATLVEALQAASADLDCFTFLPAPSSLHFWARRQAHETAIHRVDAEGAAREFTGFDSDFAQDGIAELLNGFAHRKSNAIATRGTIGLDAGDGASWLITVGGERIECVESEELVGTDVTIRGVSSDLYLWLWNRPTEAVVDGDDEIAQLWAGTVRVRWT